MAKKTDLKTNSANAAKGGKNRIKTMDDMNTQDMESDTTDMQEEEENEEKSPKNINEKAMKALIAQGRKQGFLTYDEINTALPEDMLSTDQMDDTLMMFDELGY
jgi:RNA polymerase primary sigma factor